jgi:chaperonin GroES
MKAYPLREYVVVSKDEPVKQTPGGLFVPSTIETSVVTGTVLAVGSGKLLSTGESAKLEVKEGDVVMFNRSFATEIKVDQQSCFLIKEDHLFCVVK